MEGHEILCLYCEGWDTPLRSSKHHFMTHLSRRNRVLYVEMPVHPLTALRYPEKWRRALRRWRQGPVPVQENLYTLSPLCPLPYHRASRLTSALWVNQVNQLSVLPYLRQAMRRLGFERPILWFYFPHAVSVLDRIPHKLAFFYLIDDYSAFEGVPRTYPVLERELLARADLVAALSQSLYDSRRSLCREIHLVRPGVFAEHFAKAQDGQSSVPEDIRGLRRPVIGYYGALHKLDMQLIQAMATARPHWSFLFIGPFQGYQGADVSPLGELQNVHLLGARPHESLPNYLRGVNVAILPVQVNQLTLNMCPLKLYEFLAAGKPVVSADLPEVRAVAGDLVKTARNATEFIRRIEECLAEDDPSLVKRRTALADQNSWEARFAMLETLIEGKLRGLARN